MAHHELHMPVSEAQVRALRVNDTVTLQRTLYGIRDATQIHMFDRGRQDALRPARPCRDPHRAQREEGELRATQFPAGYEPVCIGTTTSDRMERFTRPLMAAVRRAPHHRQGRAARRLARRPSATLGGVYLAIVGGTAALETTWIEQIEDVDLDDLNPESLWKFRIKDFGPLLVAMDSMGGSLYSVVQQDAQSRRAQVLAGLGVTDMNAADPPACRPTS